MAETLDWAGRISAGLRMDATAAGKNGDLLASIGSSVQSIIERSTGRRITPTAFTDVYNGEGRTVLFLNNDPIRSVTSLTINGFAETVLGPLDTPVWPQAVGCLIRPGGYLELTASSINPNFAWGAANIIVTYVAGYDPNDDGAALVQAGVEWAKQLFKNADRVGLRSTTIAGQTATYTDDMPPFMKLAIATHRRQMKWGM